MCMRLDLCKTERVWEIRAFASGGQPDGGYTTTERDLDVICRDIKSLVRSKTERNESIIFANNIWSIASLKHMGFLLWREVNVKETVKLKAHSFIQNIRHFANIYYTLIWFVFQYL